MTINKIQNGAELTVELGGRLDTTTAPELEEVLKSALEGVTDLTMDMKELEYISSAGLRVLLSAQKKMNKQGKGTILNVASSAGLLPAGPYMATYSASKAYVVSLTKAVARELKEKGSPVYVCCLCPGPVDTEFNSNADVTFALKGISARQCVRECLREMNKRKTVIVPTLRMKLAVAFQRFVPDSILVSMVGHQQKKKIYAE